MPINTEAKLDWMRCGPKKWADGGVWPGKLFNMRHQRQYRGRSDQAPVTERGTGNRQSERLPTLNVAYLWLTKYFHFCNARRLHQFHHYRTPDEAYCDRNDGTLALAA